MICTSEGCGALRDAGQYICKRCRRAAPTRPIAVGDRVPPLRARVAASGPDADIVANSCAAADADTVPADADELAAAAPGPPGEPPLRPQLPDEAA
eukprot:14656949-Heterocapsa_arctica.AAC.1